MKKNCTSSCLFTKIITNKFAERHHADVVGNFTT